MNKGREDMRILELNEDTKKDILTNLLKRSPNSYGEYESRVAAIIDAVKAKRDEAVFNYTKQFDGYDLNADNILVTEEEIKGKNVLIWDDICSKGGTFYHAAKKLKEMGAANIYLMVSHCENSIHNGEFGEEKVNLLATGLIKKVFTTDSIYSLGDSEMVMVAQLGLTAVKEDDDKCCCDCTKDKNMSDKNVEEK